MVCSSPHVLVYGVFLTPCTSLWCVPHPIYWSMVCSSPHVLVYGVFLTPCTGLSCVSHQMYWSIVCSSPHVLVCGVFLTPCTGLSCVWHQMYWSILTPKWSLYTSLFSNPPTFSTNLLLIIRGSTFSKKGSISCIPGAK